MATQTGNPYQAQRINDATPTKLVELLYEGVLRFVRQSGEAIVAGELEAAHNGILRGYAIVAELQATLDLEHGGEIASNLERCYAFVLDRLKEADIQKSVGPLEEVLRVLEPLHAAWCEAHPLGSYSAVAMGAGELERANAVARQTPPPRPDQPALDLTG